ncbi:MAG TPA: methanogen output domain 1-containing protein [Candidatus Krumholzibacteria bacterium]|nr:methanogen output domain 1-containing protein [Candidatus Krumholzibacteria bacterium]
MHSAIEALSDTRREILLRIKQSGGSTIAEIAAHLSISDEGARQHLILLERQGWVSRRPQHASDGKSGRPASVYEVSQAGEDFFPKRYADLSIALVDLVRETYGEAAVKNALASITDKWVAEWEPKLRGKTLDERLELLKSYYMEDDPFITIERNGHVALVERNCPFRDVAMQRPQLCSISTNTLSRLLGHRVSRARTFQNGDGCCEFRIHTGNPSDPSDTAFRMETPHDDESGS